MANATNGDTVRFHITLSIYDETFVHSTHESQPLEAQLGEKRMLPALEAAIVGMSPGESKSIEVEAAQAYGKVQPDMIFELDRQQFGDTENALVGHQVTLQATTGEDFPGVITAVSEAMITIDANHPLAGKDLKFDIELVEILG